MSRSDPRTPAMRPAARPRTAGGNSASAPPCTSRSSHGINRSSHPINRSSRRVSLPNRTARRPQSAAVSVPFPPNAYLSPVCQSPSSREPIDVNSLSRQRLSGWGQLNPAWCHVARPRSRDELADWLTRREPSTWIARGLGRSYGDAAVNANAGVLACDALRELIEFDPRHGILRCQAGVSIGQIVRHVVPHGWFLPVTPGTQFVTLGGAIAADVHGKNHHLDGSLGRWIEQLELLTAEGQFIRCGPDSRPELFWATVGGMGLTGTICQATLRLVPIETSYVSVDYEKTADLEHTLARLEQTQQGYRYSIVWIDGLVRGRRLGRGILMQGNPAAIDQLAPQQRDAPRSLAEPSARTLPFHLPSGTLNRATVGGLNRAFYALHPTGRRTVDLRRYFYPLDTLRHWNRLYGRRGFVQYQAVFPADTSLPAMVRLLECAQRYRVGSFFAGLKSSGPESPAMLAFMRPGHTIAIDLPWRRQLPALIEELDRLVLQHGGRLYLAKDALMRPTTFAAMYPRLGEFREVQARFDPRARISSDLARRLRILDRG